MINIIYFQNNKNSILFNIFKIFLYSNLFNYKIFVFNF